MKTSVAVLLLLLFICSVLCGSSLQAAQPRRHTVTRESCAAARLSYCAPDIGPGGCYSTGYSCQRGTVCGGGMTACGTTCFNPAYGGQCRGGVFHMTVGGRVIPSMFGMDDEDEEIESDAEFVLENDVQDAIENVLRDELLMELLSDKDGTF